MKLLLIVDDYLPNSIKVAAKMMHELALELECQGHKVTVLSPSAELNVSYIENNVDGIKVIFFRSGKIKNISKIKRAVNESLLSIFAWIATRHYFKTHSFDGIIYYSPTIFWGPLILKLKKLWHVKSYLILRDIFPQWTVDSGLISKISPIYFYFKYFEYLCYKNADFVGVMSPSNLDFFKSKNSDINKFEVLYNWSSSNILNATKYEIRKQLNLEDKIVFFYGGNLGIAQNMISLVRLAKKLQDNPKAHFLFLGKGDEVELLIKEKNKYNLDNITFLNSVDQETYFKLLSEMDIGIFCLHPNHKTHNFPGKLLGYMKYSKPILGLVNPGNDLKSLINNAEAGFIFDTGEETLLYQTAIELIESESLRNRLGENARQLLIKQFSVTKTSNQVVNRLM